MNVSVISAKRLSDEHVSAWSCLQRSDPTLQSPFLRPEYTIAVAAVRDDVDVAIVEDNGEVVGFLPFQRTRRNVGRPVGGSMTDCQAFVVRADYEWDAKELIRGCGLKAWDYNNLLASQRPFHCCHFGTGSSVYMDLSDGFETYRRQRRKSGSHRLKKIRKLTNQLGREVGPVRFESHTSDPKVLELLIEWKSDQYLRTKEVDIFSYDWTRSLLATLAAQPSQYLQGMVSALYAGDELVAIEMGLRSYDVLHEWVAAYNVEFAKYSAGNIIMVELAKTAESLGISRIDMGRARQAYKESFTSGSYDLATGSVGTSRLRQVSLKSAYRTQEMLRTSVLQAPARRVWQCARTLRGWLAFR